MTDAGLEKRIVPARRRVFALLFAAYSIAYTCRLNYSMVMPFINADLPGVATGTALAASCFFFSYACGQLIWGGIGDRVRPESMVFLGLLLSAVANLVFGFLSDAAPMAVVWLLNGLFQSMLWGPIIRMTSTLYDSDSFNKISPILMMTTVLGYMAAWSMSGALSAGPGWRWAMWTPAALAGAFSLLWFALRGRIGAVLSAASALRAQRQGGDGAPSVSAPLSTLRVLGRERLRFVVCAAFCQGIVKDGISLWAPLYFLQRFGLAFADTLAFILIIPAFNLVGVFFAGWLNKRLGYRERRAASLLFAAATAVAALMVALPGVSIAVAALLTACASALVNGINSLLLSYIPLQCSRWGKSSSVAGLMDFCSYMGIAVSSVILGGLVAAGSIAYIPASWLIAAAAGGIFMLASQWARRKKLLEGGDMA